MTRQVFTSAKFSCNDWPTWTLLTRPHYWRKSYSAWLYHITIHVFIHVYSSCEKKIIFIQLNTAWIAKCANWLNMDWTTGFDYRVGHNFPSFVTMFSEILVHSAALETGNEISFFRKDYKKWNRPFSVETKNKLGFTSIHPIHFQVTGLRHTSRFFILFYFYYTKKPNDLATRNSDSVDEMEVRMAPQVKRTWNQNDLVIT